MFMSIHQPTKASHPLGASKKHYLIWLTLMSVVILPANKGCKNKSSNRPSAADKKRDRPTQKHITKTQEEAKCDQSKNGENGQKSSKTTTTSSNQSKNNHNEHKSGKEENNLPKQESQQKNSNVTALSETLLNALPGHNNELKNALQPTFRTIPV